MKIKMKNNFIITTTVSNRRYIVRIPFNDASFGESMPQAMARLINMEKKC